VKKHKQPSVNYQALADFRYQIRRFLNFSERAARAAGLEPQQHQALLALNGLPATVQPTIGALAERLQIRHHSAVGLTDRLEARGLMRRVRGTSDRREVLLRLTGKGERILRDLSLPHRAELRSASRAMLRVLRAAIANAGRARVARISREPSGRKPAKRRRPGGAK
jgi:DNA-binding MarR family transcriptional regulator